MTYKPGPAVISQYSTVKWDRHIKSKVSVTVEISIINNDNSINHFLSRKCLFLWGSIGARSLITCTKLTRKRSQQTDLFLEQISMLYSYTCMLHSIPSTRHSLFFIQYIISGHLNSAPQNAHVAHAVSSRGESIQNLNKLPHLFTVQNVYSTRI